MKLPFVLSAFCFVLLSATTSQSFAADKPPAEPVVWGIISQNTGCVIFEEGRKPAAVSMALP
jgi:hypothetical protein